jgi:hypothetical protein
VTVRSEAARAASLDVISDLPDQFGMVGKMAERQIALVAEKAAVPACRVAVVDIQPPRSIVSAAEVASLRRDRRVGLVLGQAIAANERSSMLVVRARSIPAPITSSTLFKVLRAVFPHPLVFAFTASRLSQPASHVVEPIVGERSGFSAAATHFFHSVLHNRVSGIRRAAVVL